MTELTQTTTELTPEEQEESKARKELLIFWVRMISWIAVTLGAPIATFSIKFGLFTKYGYEVVTDELGNVVGAHIALNGWGILSIILIGSFIIGVINEVIDAYSKKYSLAKQILLGIKNRIIPIAIGLGVCYYLRGVIDQLIFCLIILGVTQIAGIILNPLPKWKAKVKGEEDYSDLITGLRQFLKSKNKEDK